MARQLLGLTISAISTSIAAAEETIQFDVASILNARPVTVWNAGHLVPWSKGIDGAGQADGYFTSAAAAAHGDKGIKALPDDGVFLANQRHPEVHLHFANTESFQPQARAVEGVENIVLGVPAKQYSRLIFFFTSAEGSSQLTFHLQYKDGSEDERKVLVPDYYNDAPAADPDVFALASDLAKWNAAGQLAEANHHFIHGVDLHPSPLKILSRVIFQKTKPAYLVFWGATGVVGKE